MLVAAEAIGEKIAHAISDSLDIATLDELDNGVHALPEFRIRHTDDDARTHLWMRADGSLDFGRIDVGPTAQDHVGQPISEIEIAIRIKPSDIAQRFPAVRAALRLGAEIMIGGAWAVIGEEIDLAGLAGRDVVAVVADDPQARGLTDLADRTLVREPFDT